MSSKANAKSIFKQVVDGCSCNLAICVLFIKVCRAFEMKRLIFIIASHLAWSILIHFTDLKKVYFLPLAATVGESRVVTFFLVTHGADSFEDVGNNLSSSPFSMAVQLLSY